MRDALDLLATLPAITPEEFGVLVERRASYLKLSQRRLAELAGIDHSTISRLFSRGKREITLETALRLSRALRNAEEVYRR